MLGNFLKATIRGASHAKKMTFTLENFPKGFKIDEEELARLMERRAPGRDKLSTQRKEADKVVFIQGVEKGVTTGEMIVGEIASSDMRPKDYGAERTIPRPGHADFGQWVQFGRIPTGGGKNSGRLTAPLCAIGGLCKQFLEQRGIKVGAGVSMIANETQADKMITAIEAARDDGDSVGGVISCYVDNPPVGLGGPLEEGLESAISAAVFAIPGVKGINFGSGDCVGERGSEYNDAFRIKDGAVVTATNRHGGILGGRTSGMMIEFHVEMRPTPTVYKAQESVDLKTMTSALCETKGRHDPCIVRRAAPVVESVAAFALADAILADEAAHPRICLTLTGKTLEEDLKQFESQRYFTDMVEVRIDLLRKKEWAKVIREEFPCPVIYTFRKKVDGGAFEGDEKIRYDFFKKLLSRLVEKAPRAGEPRGTMYVDFEEGFGDKKLVALARKAGVKIIRSVHSFEGPVKNLRSRLESLGAAGDIAKIAFMPKTAKDVDKLFADLASVPRAALGRGADKPVPPHVVCAMGPLGLPSRVLAGRLGSLWTYASVGGLGKIGHLSPYDLVRDYRFRSVTKDAEVVRVPAEQVAEMNAAFLREDEDKIAIPL